jgi:hypothetical protein
VSLRSGAPAPALDASWTLLSAVSGSDEQIGIDLYRHDDTARHAIRFDGAADFVLDDDTIAVHLYDLDFEYAMEVWFLGSIFSFWSELRGCPALHAAAVVVEGRALGFLATNKGGKSSLAATLMQKGHPLLTDDILVLDRSDAAVVGQPSYPQMRMWPDQAAHFLGAKAAQALPRVVPHLSKRRVPVGRDGLFGNFCETAHPISTLFLPERRTDVQDVRVERLSLSEALIELVRHSFLANAVEALGLAPRRLPVLFALANQVCMYRLVYPDGVEHLSHVADAVVRLVSDDLPPVASAGTDAGRGRRL